MIGITLVTIALALAQYTGDCFNIIYRKPGGELIITPLAKTELEQRIDAQRSAFEHQAREGQEEVGHDAEK